jgi:phosphoribosyl 1,2-cyclic phosphodiesterase
MIRFAVLGSGSSGNAYIIGTSTDALLIDAGFSLKQLKMRSESAGFDFSTVKALCITHLHPDHGRSAGVFARKTGKDVYVHESLYQGGIRELKVLGIPEGQLQVFAHGKSFQTGPFTVTAFPTSHDSPFSSGFVVQVQKRVFTILTDTGILDAHMHRYAQASDVLFLESNYDEQMLTTGPYPVMLKRRIAGERGHLSNVDALDLLNGCEKTQLSQVYFCHLSKTNNRPDMIISLCARKLTYTGNWTVCEHGQLYSGCIAPGGVPS